MRSDGLILVIPTLWIPTSFHRALNVYIKSEAIQSIILVDNNPAGRTDEIQSLLSCDKITILEQSKNLFVNASWNLGVSRITKPDALVGILNDDILIPHTILEKLRVQLKDQEGITGLLQAESGDPDLLIQEIVYDPCRNIGAQYRGFGSALFFKKKDYVPINSSLKIWFGDDWLLRNSTKVNGIKSSKIEIANNITISRLKKSRWFKELIQKDKAAANMLLF